METLLSLMRKIGVKNFQTGDWMDFVGLQSFGKFCRQNIGLALREFRNKYRS